MRRGHEIGAGVMEAAFDLRRREGAFTGLPCRHRADTM